MHSQCRLLLCTCMPRWPADAPACSPTRLPARARCGCLPPQLLMDGGLVRSMHRVYVRAHSGDEKLLELDPLRKLVLELLTAKDQFKK